jgi:hypothetical protein
MNTRGANSQEKALVKRFERAIIDGRKKISAYLGLCGCLALAEKWRQAEVRNGALSPGAYPPLFTPAEVAAARKTASRWNALEDALTGLQTQEYGIKAHQNDLDIIKLEPEPASGLGFPVLVVVSMVTSVVIAGVIALAIKYATGAERKAQENNARILELNASMADKPAHIQESWRRLQKSAPWQQQSSFWDALKSSASKVAAIALGGLLLWGFYQAKKPQRRRLRLQNPCPTRRGGGTVSDPTSWNVKWSHDPKAIRRQLDYVLKKMGRSDVKQYENFFDPLLEIADTVNAQTELEFLEPMELEEDFEY